MHKADKRYLIEYRYANTAWMMELWADDVDDARRKLRALATNGEVLGEAMMQIALPGPLVRFIGWMTRWMRP